LSDNNGAAPPDVGQIQIQRPPGLTDSYLATLRIVPQELLTVMMMMNTLIVPRVNAGQNALIGQ
jgi:hypothetical protein